MRIYKHREYNYVVLEHKGFNIRGGYTKLSDTAIFKHIGTFCDVFAVWLFGIFFQFDYDK